MVSPALLWPTNRLRGGRVVKSLTVRRQCGGISTWATHRCQNSSKSLVFSTRILTQRKIRFSTLFFAFQSRSLVPFCLAMGIRVECFELECGSLWGSNPSLKKFGNTDITDDNLTIFISNILQLLEVSTSRLCNICSRMASPCRSSWRLCWPFTAWIGPSIWCRPLLRRRGRMSFELVTIGTVKDGAMRL